MKMKLLNIQWLLWILSLIFSIYTADNIVNEEKYKNITDKCLKFANNQTHKNISIFAEDGREKFGGPCRSGSKLVTISNQYEACLVKGVSEEYAETSIWANILKPNNTKLTLHEALYGIDLNVTHGSSNSCIAMNLSVYSDANATVHKGNWSFIFKDCDEKLTVVCEEIDNYTSTKNISSTNNIFADLFRQRERRNYFEMCENNYEEECDKFESVLKKDECFAKFAASEKKNCERQNDLGTFEQVKIQTLNSDDITSCHGNTTFERFAVGCPILSNTKTKVLKLASAELNVDSVEKFVKNMVDTYDWNRRRMKFLPKNGRLLSINLIDELGRKISPIKIDFKCKFDARKLIAESARAISFENNDESLLANTNHYESFKTKCVFVDPKSKLFNTTGCECKQHGNEARCTSNHTTIFTVMLAVDTVIIPRTVKIASIVMQSISLAFLAIAFCILVKVRKKVRGERIAIQINLVVSLALLHFWILLSDIAVRYSTLCRAVAVLMHFFLLSTALWMTNEAMLLFLKTSKWAFVHAKRRKIVIISMIFSWGVAGLICSITAAIGFSNNTYMESNKLNDIAENKSVDASSIPNYEYCWLSATSGIRLTAIVPVAILLALNLIIAIRVGVFVYTKTMEAKHFRPTQQMTNKHMLDVDYLKNLCASIKATVLLLPTLGIPWVFLFAANTSDRTTQLVFMYVNVVLNGLQGFFVFIVYCVVGKEVRAATVKSLSASLMNNSWSGPSDTFEKWRKRKSHQPVEFASTSAKDTVNVANNESPVKR